MPRERLPDRRHSWNQKIIVCGRSVHVSFGEYEDGRLGEIFIDIDRVGSMTKAVLGTLATYFSISIQTGMPLEQALEILSYFDFLPQGRTVVLNAKGEEDLVIKESKSILDAIAQVIRKVYIETWEIEEVAE